ncbi:MAG: hypothetical protein JXA04_02170 [Gammaproteobacteria bacterium]|nr:hypothetical protein [Gammaproteobacteria bacterium]
MSSTLNPRKWLTPILLIMCCTMGAALAEEENYYLEQMRKQAQTDAGQPAQMLPEQDGGLLAETDLTDLTKTDDDLDDLNKVKPELNLFKPEL